MRGAIDGPSDDELEDRVDYAESEASLADGSPLPADDVWNCLGL